MNGFNRFDPKYVSIGPKALRESSFANVTNVNKCATLRHGGRYGGSLSGSFDRGPNPVLKKAPPPSVATVSKEFNVAAISEQPSKTPASATNSITFSANTLGGAPNRSNASLAGVVGSGFGSGYETDSGATKPHRKSAFKQPSNEALNTKRDPNMYEPAASHGHNVVIQHPSVYSIDTATYRAPMKTPQKQQQQQQQLLQQQLTQQQQQQQIQQLQQQIQQQQLQQQQLQQQQQLHQLQQMQQQQQHLPPHGHNQLQPALPAKQSRSPKVSIVHQPLPEIPTAKPAEVAQIRNIQQPLSAANLDNYRSLQKTALVNAGLTTSSSLKSSHSSQTRSAPPKQASAPPSSKPTIPLPPKILPPMLPPKNRSRDHSDGTATISRKNNNSYAHHYQSQSSGTSTLPSQSKSHASQRASIGASSAAQQQAAANATYSTFGYDSYHIERDPRKYSLDRDAGRQMVAAAAAAAAASHPYPNAMSYEAQCQRPSASQRQQSYQTMPHKAKEMSAMRERDRDRDRSGHHHSSSGAATAATAAAASRQYGHPPGMSAGSGRRYAADDAGPAQHSHRQQPTAVMFNRHGGMHGLDPSDLAGEPRPHYPQSILRKHSVDPPFYTNDMYSVTEL